MAANGAAPASLMNKGHSRRPAASASRRARAWVTSACGREARITTPPLRKKGDYGFPGTGRAGPVPIQTGTTSAGRGAGVRGETPGPACPSSPIPFPTGEGGKLDRLWYNLLGQGQRTPGEPDHAHVRLGDVLDRPAQGG